MTLATREPDAFYLAYDSYLAGFSGETARQYTSRLTAFEAWRYEQPPEPFVTLLKRYVYYLKDGRGLAPRSVRAHINTIKGFLHELAYHDPELALALPLLAGIKTPVVRGEVVGQRLTAAQAHQLLEAPGLDDPRGWRDTALLGMLLVLGLRRSEVCDLTWGHLQELDGHRAITNLVGKHGRVRTMKLPPWLWRATQGWGERGKLYTHAPCPVFVPIRKGGKIARTHKRMSPQSVYLRVQFWLKREELPPVKPHDLRRTAALLSRRGGASIEQVQLMLGHASPQTTSNYIGETLDLDDNAVDYSPLKREGV